MSAEQPEEVSAIPVVAAAVQVSENQETRDAAIEANVAAETAQATAEVAGNTALAAEEDAQTAAEVAVVSAEIGTEAAVSAEEAKQEAGEALSEIGQLRQDIFQRLDSIHTLLQPPEPEPEPDNGVKEVVLDGTDIGESGLESGKSGGAETPVSDSEAGSSGRTTSARRASGFRRGRR